MEASRMSWCAVVLGWSLFVLEFGGGARAIQPVRSHEEILRLLGVRRTVIIRDCPPCHGEWDPLCGSDGKTYYNGQCMRSISCRRGRDVGVLHFGPCTFELAVSGRSPRSPQEVDPIDDDCPVPVTCGDKAEFVCASNGKTFRNRCIMESWACHNNEVIHAVHSGPCSRNKRAIDERCPMCSRDYNPVCGSDGVEYSNPCMLRYTACTEHRRINFAAWREC
ncbi:unnamed protein product [Darwinula stevensoni]|uniref:Kazal-like domain-containing protein n=1 Tax=Darwinula stevensoni TaxID=69355 RepID=A0A7R9A135_9CRUS|nr:unnamed protein product [Darwinula stevensoni]CAG0885742.1 unnamed protein product [Darwinula stevensoni]